MTYNKCPGVEKIPIPVIPVLYGLLEIRVCGNNTAVVIGESKVVNYVLI